MKLHFSSIKINRILPVNWVSSLVRAKLPNQLPDRFERMPSVKKNMKMFFTENSGAFSFEDLKRIELYKQFYLKSGKDLDEERKLLSEALIKDADSCFESNNENCLPHEKLVRPDNVTQDFKNRSKDITLRLFSIKKIKEENPLHQRVPMLSDWFDDTLLGMQNPFFTNSIYKHPIDKALGIVGSLVREDYEKINLKTQKYFNLSDKKLQKMRSKILKKLANMFEANQSDFAGYFTDSEFKKIRALVIDFEGINRVQAGRGIYTKDKERIEYASKISDDVKKDDYINGLGYVANRFALKLADGNSIQALTLFSNDWGANVFRIYNLDKLLELKKRADKAVLKEEKDALVSEVRCTYINSDKGYYISHLHNHDSKKYPNAGIIVGLELLRLLEKKNCLPLSLRAEAYAENKRSPVNYYRYFGFSPVDYTEKELNKIMDSNNGVFPVDIPVWFSLNSFEKLKCRMKIYEQKFFNQ